jgi:VanZ family protein
MGRFLLPSFAWGILILLLYSIPGSDVPSLDLWGVIGIDKIAHATLFAIFVVILIVGFKRQSTSRILRRRAILVAIISAATYGAILEGIQGMVFVQRTTDIVDLMANIIGAFTGIVIFRIIYGNVAHA